jgi:predicted enzyme related to lactoylglutathione lyase
MLVFRFIVHRARGNGQRCTGYLFWTIPCACSLCPVPYPLFPMITQGLAKIILYVKDMDKQVSFYRNSLDLKVKYPEGLDNYKEQIWVELVTGECTNNCIIALHFDRDKQLGKDRPKLVFSVEDIEVAHQMLIDRGVKLSPINSRQGNAKVADGFDPEGNPFSIYCQPNNSAEC